MYKLNASVCTTSTALPSFSHDQHHKTDVALWTGGYYHDKTFTSALEQSWLDALPATTNDSCGCQQH